MPQLGLCNFSAFRLNLIPLSAASLTTFIFSTILRQCLYCSFILQVCGSCSRKFEGKLNLSKKRFECFETKSKISRFKILLLTSISILLASPNNESLFNASTIFLLTFTGTQMQKLLQISTTYDF